MHGNNTLRAILEVNLVNDNDPGREEDGNLNSGFGSDCAGREVDFARKKSRDLLVAGSEMKHLLHD